MTTRHSPRRCRTTTQLGITTVARGWEDFNGTRGGGDGDDDGEGDDDDDGEVEGFCCGDNDEGGWRR